MSRYGVDQAATQKRIETVAAEGLRALEELAKLSAEVDEQVRKTSERKEDEGASTRRPADPNTAAAPPTVAGEQAPPANAESSPAEKAADQPGPAGQLDEPNQADQTDQPAPKLASANREKSPPADDSAPGPTDKPDHAT